MTPDERVAARDTGVCVPVCGGGEGGFGVMTILCCEVTLSLSNSKDNFNCTHEE